jgi:hypothetical protein
MFFSLSAVKNFLGKEAKYARSSPVPNLYDTIKHFALISNFVVARV